MDARTQDIIERMGLFFEKDGLPRIAGRVLGYLLLSPERSSLDHLADALQVSKSSVSTDARMLERIGVVERVTIPGDRRDYYQIAADVPHRMAALWRERLIDTRDLLEDALETPEAETEEVRRRLRAGARLMMGLAEAVEEAGGRLQEGSEERSESSRSADLA